MGNIFNIINRIFPFIVLVIFEILSFYIIAHNNEFYESKFINQTNFIVNNFYNKVQNVKDYFNLRQTNQDLIQENATLYKSLLSYQKYYDEKQEDSVASIEVNRISKFPGNFTIKNARIVENSITNLKNYIIIDKGSDQGIEKDMGLITPDGPVGMIISVTKNYSTAMSLLNKDATIGAKITRVNVTGQLKWSLKDYRIAYLEDIPRHIQIKKGDIVTTSGFSTYFPKDLPIGKVINIKQDKSYNFSKIEVLLFNNFSQLEYVFVVKNTNQEELQTLEKEINELQTKVEE